MKSFVLVLILFASVPAIAGDDLLEHQLEKNARRRSRQAEIIKNMDDDKKADAIEKAHERNKNVRSRQKELHEEINERD